MIVQLIILLILTLILFILFAYIHTHKEYLIQKFRTYINDKKENLKKYNFIL